MFYKIRKLIKSEVFAGILLTICFALAIFLSNVEQLSDEYNEFVFYIISFKVGSFSYNTTLINLLNDGLMTFFFLLIGLELKYHLSIGEYSDKKALMLPTASAVGGVIIPSAIYAYFNFNETTIEGWAIPMATDTAFMLGILSFFHRHVSLQLRAFVISFSLIDDALALIVLALFYTKTLDLDAFCVSLVLLAILVIFNYLKIRNSIYYLLVGSLLWIAMVEAGIHGTLCGVIIAITIPVHINDTINTSFRKLENILRPVVNYFILPLFVFTNSGIKLKNLFSISADSANISWGIILGLFIGKQLGIFSFSYIATKYKHWCKLPIDTNWLRFYAISVLGGIGFTLSFFIGGLTFETGYQYYAMKRAIIIGSSLSAIMGFVLLCYASLPGAERKNGNN